ncbi:MAG TPA: prephenate dehydrogenase/arogenate dehydrogenase family protein [Bryobacteraceae bacterium]|nr:prephenate dehydrogenase/arogenate dehydrogenase family protein [Bryobacteraceae bacterium]
MKTVVVVGVGLIGGSFALALRESGFRGTIIGVSSPDAVRVALEKGIIDEALPLAEAAAIADLIYLARPIEGILAALDELDSFVKPGTLITDAGSTKAAICARAAEKIRLGRFVGGHPMAGKEARGAQEADGSLFRGRPYVLTSRCAELEETISNFGARLVFISAEEHDVLVALTSHLPQLISTALAASIATQPEAARVAGPAAMDLTRLALSPYEIWRDIFATNATNIDAALGVFIEKIEGLRAELRARGMEREFENAAAAARGLRGK